MKINKNSQDVAYELDYLINQYFSTTGKTALDTRYLKRSIDLSTNDFLGYSQRDALELILFLLNYIHKRFIRGPDQNATGYHNEREDGSG